MKGMILAAGFGTRLQPITDKTPKPMVPLCNRPLLEWAIESYRAAGVRDLIVNVHHLPEVIERFLRERFDRVEISFEEKILGTGGAIRRVRPLLENESAFFLANGDTPVFRAGAAATPSATTRGSRCGARRTIASRPSTSRTVASRIGKATATLMFAGCTSSARALDVRSTREHRTVDSTTSRRSSPAPRLRRRR
jgi:UTP-glucose-1-phosphate uridylyltransferase